MSLVLEHTCDDILSTKIMRYFSQHFINFPCICEACVHIGLLTLTSFNINYHVNNDTPFRLFRCVISNQSIYNSLVYTITS